MRREIDYYGLSAIIHAVPVPNGAHDSVALEK